MLVHVFASKEMRMPDAVRQRSLLSGFTFLLEWGLRGSLLG